MTTIAAISLDGIFALAADGQSSCDGDIVGTRDVKVMQPFGCEAVVAYAGVGSAGDAIRRAKLTRCNCPYKFAEAIRAELDRWGHRSDDGTYQLNCSYVFMTDSGIWAIYGDLSVIPVEEGLPAGIGSGGPFAAGAMEVMLQAAESDLQPEDVVTTAVQVAAKRDSGTGNQIMLAVRGKRQFGPEWVEVESLA